MKKIKRGQVWLPLFLATFLCLGQGFAESQTATDSKGSARYIQAVRAYAEKVLQNGRDVYGPVRTPLLMDGLNVNTLEPAKWVYGGPDYKHDGHVQKAGDEWILSNLASQQNFLRVLDGLSKLTGNARYHEAAAEIVSYAFEHLTGANGLLHWGGHVAYDALGDRPVMEAYKHELKCHYPYYELMWEVNPEAMRRYFESLWAAHILDWSNLDMNRHGGYDARNEKLWENAYAGGEVFFWGKGLTFLNAGSDFVYAAAQFSRFSGEKAPLTWSKRLAYRYVETRNPKTGIGGFQYSQLATAQCNDTGTRGDRAQYQFAEFFPGHHVVEGTLFPCYGNTPHVGPQIALLFLGEMLGDNGTSFTQWAIEEMTAWGKSAYRESDNSFIPMLTDGTSLEGFVIRKEGYFGPKGRVITAGKAGADDFYCYALGWRVSGDAFCWKMARTIARSNKWGDIGETPATAPRLKADIAESAPELLLAFLELHRKTGRAEFLEAANRIGGNILTRSFHKDFFLPEKDRLFARISAVEPLVLLRLAAALEGKDALVPRVWPSSSFFHCPYQGRGRTYDTQAIYSQKAPR